MEAEATVWADARAGDARAFTTVFCAHRDRVFRAASRLVDSAADADDVTAVVFLELWRRREAVRVVDGTVLPWLLVTAVHVARNLRRGTLRYRRLLDRLPRDEPRDPAQQALDRVAAGREATAAALRRLDPADLALLVLTSLEGYGVAEAAAAVGLSLPAARSRLSWLKSRLRGELAATIDERTGHA